MFQLFTTLAAVLLIVLDQLSKKWIVSTLISGDIIYNGKDVIYHLSDIKEIPLIEKVLYFKFAPNTGVAFSMLSDSRWFLITVTALMISVCLAVYVSGKIKDKLEIFSLALIIAGGIGNLIDRIRLGYVVDFIDVRIINFAIFNVADICITVGAFLLLFAAFAEDGKNGKKENMEKESAESGLECELPGSMSKGDS